MAAHKMFENGKFAPPRRHSEATIRKMKKSARRAAQARWKKAKQESAEK
jgi:hypothetical protein